MRAVWCTAAVTALVALGCGQAPPPLVTQLDGRLVSDAPVVAAFDHRWAPRDRGIGLRRAGVIVVDIGGSAVAGVLAVALHRPRGVPPAATWDDEPVEVEVTEQDRWSIRVTGPAAGGGRHRLELVAQDVDDDPARKVRLTLRAVTVALDDAEPVEVERDAVLGPFLDAGVAGPAGWKTGGCLFDGPGGAGFEFAIERPATLMFRVGNSSPGNAEFRLELAGQTRSVQVPPREQRDVEVPVAGGRHRLRLEVSGGRHGRFLWGAPALLDPASHRPPVLFVTLDTTRRDAVAPYDPFASTPHLARLAAGATTYEHAVATAPWTLPTHASMFTGLYPSHHGAGVTLDELPVSADTMAEHLRRVGYTTVGLAGGAIASSRFGLAQGFAAYFDPPQFEVRGDELVSNALLAFERFRDGPLFLFVNLFDPHGPYDAPPPFGTAGPVVEAASRVVDLPVWSDLADARGGMGDGENPAWREVKWGRAGAPEDGLRYLRAVYDAEVAFTDHQLGRLLDAYRDAGLYDDALIVVVADHGELLGEGGRFTHSYWLDPELTEVPLIVKWPGQAEPEVVTELVSQVDLFASVLAAVGIEAAPGDGIPFGPDGATAAHRERAEVWMEEHASRYHQLEDQLKLADHLYGRQHRGNREVFWRGGTDCAEGVPGGWRSVPCAVGWDSLFEQLPDRMREVADLAVDHRPSDLTDEEAERLRALGYLQ